MFAVHLRLFGNNGGGIVGIVDLGLFVGGGVIKGVVWIAAGLGSSIIRVAGSAARPSTTDFSIQDRE